MSRSGHLFDHCTINDGVAEDYSPSGANPALDISLSACTYIHGFRGLSLLVFCLYGLHCTALFCGSATTALSNMDITFVIV